MHFEFTLKISQISQQSQHGQLQQYTQYDPPAVLLMARPNCTSPTLKMTCSSHFSSFRSFVLPQFCSCLTYRRRQQVNDKFQHLNCIVSNILRPHTNIFRANWSQSRSFLHRFSLLWQHYPSSAEQPVKLSLEGNGFYNVGKLNQGKHSFIRFSKITELLTSAIERLENKIM